MTIVDRIFELDQQRLRLCLGISLSELHGARHGNINSPENLTVDNCPQCSALLSDDPMASARADIENGCVELNR